MKSTIAAIASAGPQANSAAYRLVFVAFAAFGFVAGLWQAALPDLQAALAMSPGALGAAITVGFLASFPAMLAGGRLADRWGARPVIAATALLIGLAFLGFALIYQYWMILVLMLFFLGGFGGLDVGINTAAIGVEQVSGRRILIYFHAAFSGSAAAAALLTGLLLWGAAPFRLLYLGAAALMAVLAWVIWSAGSFPRAPSRPLQPRPPAARERAGAGWRHSAVLLLAVVVALALLSESTLETWSAIYLRAGLGLPVLLGALGPAVFHTAMLTGRVAAGTLIARAGRRRLLFVSGGLVAGGMALALATTVPPLILAGFLLAGLALSAVVPVGFSLAGDFAPGRAGAATSTLTTIGYLGLLVAPLLVGSLAEVAGLRLALGVLVAAGGLIVLLSLGVREAQPST